MLAAALGVGAFMRGTRWYGGIAAVVGVFVSVFLTMTIYISPQQLGPNAIKVGDTLPRFTAVDEFGKAFDVLIGDDLDVYEREVAARFGLRLPRDCDGVQGLVNRAIAKGMDVNVDIACRRVRHHRRELGLAEDCVSGVAGIVLVILEHRRGPRLESPVVENLERIVVIAIALEFLTGMKRAGADFIVTYWALRAADWLKN